MGLQKLKIDHRLDPEGNPAGGTIEGTGLLIEFQNGALGTGADRKEPNGAFVEGLIQAAISRLEHYQSTKFKCRENAVSITYLETGLLWLQKRTMEREARGIEGTHTV